MNFEKLKSWVIYPALLCGGLVVGLIIPFAQIRDAVAAIFELESKKEVDDEPEDEAMHVEITETAQKSLGLKIQRVKLGSYQPTYDVPAIINELSSAQSLSISSRFEGIVKKVFVSQGQSVKPGDLIFELELTGELLSKAQSELLLAIKKSENVQSELNRLGPLVQSGGIANKRYLDLSYEQNQLIAEIDTKEQELLLHGLKPEQVQSIRNSKKLVRTIQVRVPDKILPPQINLSILELSGDSPTFIVETLFIKPGAFAPLGASLCDLAYHEYLVVEGQAYEKDIPRLRQMHNEKIRLSMNVGSEPNTTTVEGCQIAYIGNHANSDTNTFSFYVYLRNELIDGEQSTSGQKTTPGYLSWRWKPGQRAHLRIPMTEYENMLIVPRDAVAEDGVSRIVFEWKGQVAHDHEEEEGHADHEHADEYEPVEVNVVFMDQKTAVIDAGGRLKEGTRIAFNHANQLLFSMQSGGGHGHSHSHDH